MSEHDEQAALFQRLALAEPRYPFLKWIYAVPNGGLRHPAVAAKLKAEGVKSGVFDICVPIPRNGYHGMYIEMKYGKNGLTPEQEQFWSFAIEHGYRASICYGWESAAVAIGVYLGIEL